MTYVFPVQVFCFHKTRLREQVVPVPVPSALWATGTGTGTGTEQGREVGGWGRDPKKCTGRDWGMGSSTI